MEKTHQPFEMEGSIRDIKKEQKPKVLSWAMTDESFAGICERLGFQYGHINR